MAVTTDTPLERFVARLREHGSDPFSSGGRHKFMAKCPAHRDDDPSLSVREGDDGRVLVKCFASCETSDVCEALDLTLADLFRHERGRAVESGQTLARREPAGEEPEPLPTEGELREYRDRLRGDLNVSLRLTSERCWDLGKLAGYDLGLDERGTVTIPVRAIDGTVPTVERYQPFAERAGPKMRALKGRRRWLLLPPGDVPSEVFVTEGYSDALAAASHDLPVVGAPSAVWKVEWTETLVAVGVKRVYVAGDCDGAGRKLNQRVGEALTARGIEVHVIDLAPERSDGYDLTDHLRKHREDPAIGETLRSLARPYEPSSSDERQPAGKGAAERFELVRPSLSNVTPICWAWRDWLALGIFNLLVGEEGAGKGTLIAYLIAQLTRGELDGDLHGEPCTVLILGDEDDFDRVWTPRLYAAGADLDRIRNVRGEHGQALSFPSGIDTLRGFVVETGARVVFFDSLLDNLDAGIDDWRSQQVRSALGPLHAVARELDFAAIGSLHANKARGGSFRQSVQGSHAFNAISKSSLLVAKHPDGPEERRVVARGKGNYAQRPISREFTIAGRSPKIGDHVIQTSVATDFADCPLTADDLLAPPKREPTSKAGRARAYIEQALADGQPHDAAPIIEYLSTEFDLDVRAIRKARELVGAISEKRPEFQGASTWRLPTEAEQFTRIGPFGRTGAETEGEAA